MSTPSVNGHAEQPDPLIGQTVERYRFEWRLGRGGMAVVYAAMHVELQQRFAVKVVKPEVTYMPAGVERFRREARVASNLGHPLLLGVFDFGTLPDGRPYFVMPMLNGQTLRESLREGGPWAIPRVAETLRGTMKAIDTMHAKGLVHRDIKPDNLFLSVDERTGEEEVVVMDFGLTTFFETPSKLTHPGMMLGTPAYMTPESALQAQRDPTADLYAMAVVLYELVTGNRPFSERDPRRLMHQRLVEDPRPPSTFRPSLPPGTDAFFARALSRHPFERFGSCGAMLSAFAALDEGGGEESAPPEARQRVSLPQSKTVSTGAGLRFGAMLLLAVLLLALAIHYVLRDPSPPPSSRAPSAAEAGHAERLQPPPSAELNTDPPDEVPVPVAETVAGPGSVAEPVDGPGSAAPAAAALAATPPGPARLEGARAAEPPAAPVAPPDPALAVLLAAGRSALLRGRPARARTEFESATRVAPTSADAWIGLAMAHETMGAPAAAARALRRARRVASTDAERRLVAQRLGHLEPGVAER